MQLRRMERIGRVGLVAGVSAVVGWTVLTANPVAFVSAVAYGAVGTLLAIRRPRNVIGWLLIALAVLLAKPELESADDVRAVAAGTGSAVSTLVVWLEAWLGALGYMTFLALAVLFPSGRLPEGPWRTRAIVTLGAAVALVTAMAFAPTIRVAETDLRNPLALVPGLPIWRLVPNGGYLFLPLLGVVAAGVVSLVVRHRQASGILRQQLRWLVTAILFLLGALAFGLVGSGVTGTVNSWPWLPTIVVHPTVPIAIGIAVFRHRLYDIDRILSRTIAYGIVSAILAIVFGGVIVLLSAVLAPFTQGQTIAVAASTLAAFAIFQPVLVRVRRAVDRRFNRARYEAEPAVAAFSARLRDEVDIAAVSRDLHAIVEDTVHPASLGLWIRQAKN
jgi:hypothetical protein